jgi:hypothetical protein
MFAYRWGARGDVEAQYEPAIAAATAPLRQQLAAVRVSGVDTASKSFRIGDVNFIRELFAIDVYANIPPEDPEQDAVFAPPWSTSPWHLMVLMEEAVGRGWAAFSQAEAARRGVEWLDLVRSDEIKTRLTALVDQFERQAFRPDILQSLVSADDARKRWAALSAFYRSHGHFLVTNGPYQLKSWSGESASLEVFRDLSYPLGVGSYDNYAIPRRGYVAGVERQDRVEPCRRHDFVAGELEIGDTVIGCDLLQRAADLVGDATRYARKPHRHRRCIGEPQHHNRHAGIDLGVKRRRVDLGWAQISREITHDSLGRGDRFADSAGLACEGCDRCIRQTERHHIGDRPDKVAAARGAGRVLKPNGADDPVVPAYRHREQGPGAERAQDLMELHRTAIPGSIGDLDLFARQ